MHVNAIPPAVHTHYEPQLMTPDKFDGNCRHFCGLMNQCQLLFLLLPQTFPTDRTRMALICSLMSGETLPCASPLLEKSSSLLGHFEFIQAMSVVFDDPNHMQTAKAIILTLQRDAQLVTSYTLFFRHFVSDTRWNKATQHYHFRLGLHNDNKTSWRR